jgi:DNA polymerase III delta subunit
MYYFLHGEDTKKAVDKAKQMVDSMVSKKPNASVFKLDEFNWESSLYQELLGGQALFENKYIVMISRVFDNPEAKDTLLDSLKELKNSENVFIWVEGEVDSKNLKKIEGSAEKVQSFEIKLKTKKPDFNIFALSDALSKRDKKSLWVKYHEALEFQAVEEIHGTLFWQLKSMVIASKTTLDKSGMKPFVYDKAKSGASKYTKEELEKMSEDLISISHDSRRGKHDFKVSMERFILEI